MYVVSPVKRFLAFVALFPAVAVYLGQAQDLNRQPNGAIVHSARGFVRVEVCSDSVIHIVAGRTDTLTQPVVPAVIRPCTGAKFTTVSEGSRVQIQTDKLKVEVDKDTGSVKFLTRSGESVLSEQPHNDRTIPGARF